MKWIILTLLFGWTGCYQFHKGHKGKGFLRLFTIGIFGIGWIIDFFASIKDAFQNRKKKKIKPSSEPLDMPKISVPNPSDYIHIETIVDGEERKKQYKIDNAPRPQGEVINRYNMCLVRDGIDFYHTEEECRYVKMASNWRTIPVTEAKKLKLTWCDECRFEDYKRRHPEKYDPDYEHDDDSEEDDDE